ncbi:MAG TPA: PQQ-dependent sugar dehydrogenase [Burkholderiaceae bacterium]|nr:PQQ-dependent sugar dehydrogenase [Burkholderiaceae bacterium]
MITSPAEGATYRAGDTLPFSASATDAQDGPLDAGHLTWWVDFHHDAHTHPFVQETEGNSGTVSVLTRGETSDNVWLRFHLRATDSAGLSTEVTRDVMPQKVQFTLTTRPSGLTLTLDGQPFSAPRTVTGVMGLERDLGAADQVLDGRIYRFSNWNDGGDATHTITTPPTSRLFIATFIDAGPAINQPPTVALTAPADGSSGFTGTPITLTATAADGDGSIAGVQFFDGATAIGAADTTLPFSVSWTPSTTGVHVLTAQATDNGGASTTSAAVSVTITTSNADTQPPVVKVTAPAPFADGLTGTVAFNADVTDNVGVSNVEFQIDGVPLTTDTSAPYSTTVDTNLHAAGQHVLRVRAADSAGNRSAWTSLIVRFGGTREVPAGITRTLNWATGFSVGTAFTELPDGRLLVAEQRGALRVVQSDGTLLGTPMLTLTVDAFQDLGLLGVVAHPQFSSNGFIYVYYTTSQGGRHNRLSRFTVSGNTATGEVVLANLPTLSASVHGGGGLRFGSDGKLYVGVGDGGVSTNAPDLNTPLGKLLRFNDDGSIPSDNPFCTTQGNLACAVWAYGLRNPFTLAVQPGTGRIHINDVGEATWEEIDVAARRANYGWPASEGPNGVTASITGPLFTYKHTATSPPGTGPGGFFVGSCVIGGGFYPNGGPFPAPWRGGYFFTDCVTNFVGFIDLNNDSAAYSFGTVPGAPSAPVGLLVARDGALLVLQRYGITRFTAP